MMKLSGVLACLYMDNDKMNELISKTMRVMAFNKRTAFVEILGQIHAISNQMLSSLRNS